MSVCGQVRGRGIVAQEVNITSASKPEQQKTEQPHGAEPLPGMTARTMQRREAAEVLYRFTSITFVINMCGMQADVTPSVSGPKACAPHVLAAF